MIRPVKKGQPYTPMFKGERLFTVHVTYATPWGAIDDLSECDDMEEAAQTLLEGYKRGETFRLATTEPDTDLEEEFRSAIELYTGQDVQSVTFHEETPAA